MRVILSLLVGVLLASAAVSETSPNSFHRSLEREKINLARIPQERLDALLAAPARKPLKRGGASVDYSRNWLQSQPAATGGPEWRCLAEALYFEARGESVKGQFAVAEVILNRVDSARFPGSVCKVINQGTGRKYACQFTYTCDGKKEIISEPRAWERVAKVARAMIDGAPRRLTDGATYYHTKAVRPSWSRKFARTTTIGVHHFYRPQTRLSQN